MESEQKEISQEDIAEHLRRIVGQRSPKNFVRAGVFVFGAGFLSFGFSAYLLGKFIGKRRKTIVEITRL